MGGLFDGSRQDRHMKCPGKDMEEIRTNYIERRRSDNAPPSALEVTASSKVCWSRWSKNADESERKAWWQISFAVGVAVDRS